MLRSLLFNIAFISLTVIQCIIYLPSMVSDRAVAYAARTWARSLLWAVKVVAGINIELRGTENILNSPAIYASKHQSALDTLILAAYVPNPVFVLKRELLFLPFVGLYFWRLRSVALDRKAGASAIRKMVREAQERLKEGRSVIVFPEGTRTLPDAPDPAYLPGIAALYSQANVPVVPVALNSGVCWAKNAFVKRRGTVTVEYLSPIPPGIERKTFLNTLKERIEMRSKELVAQARATLKH